MNDYKGFKSQALDFNVYSDGIDVIAVTPQYALTRENNGIQYYSTSGWQGLTIETTIEDALTDTQDAWWVGTAFETLLNVYWDADDNAYPNTLWTREETKYSSGNSTYSTPTKDTGGSAIGKWCLNNDRTIINGAHIGTGTIDAYSINTEHLGAQIINTGVLSANNIVVSSGGEKQVTLENQLEDINTRFTTVDTTIDQLQFGVQNLVTSANAVVTNPGDSTVTDGIYTVYTPQFQHGIKLDSSIFELNKSYVISFKLKDLYGESIRTDGGIIPEDIKPNTRITAIGGHCLTPWGAFEIKDAIIDGKTPSTSENYDTGYSLDLNETIHTVVLFLKKVDGTITGDDAAVYIQPGRNYYSDTPYEYTTLCDIWDLVVAESNAIPTSWINYQYTTTEPMETPDSFAVWADSFPDEWAGKSTVWRRTKTCTSTGHVSYSEPVMLSTADAARIAANVAGESVGDWCLAHDVTVIDGANLMTGTIDASKVKVTNLDASQITAGMFTVGKDGPDEGTDLDDDSEIIFQAGYTKDENNNDIAKVKIGGFVVDTNTIASGDRKNNVGIILTSTDGQDGNAKVIQAGTNFSVDADGKIVSTGGKIGGLDISTRKLTGRLYNNAESALKGVELGITTANHIVPLTITPPGLSNYEETSPETATVDINKTDFGYASQVTTTTSDGTTTQTTKALNWTLYWTSEEQSGGTYIYKAFRSISDKNVDIDKPFEKLTGVSITQIDDSSPATDLNYENIYTPDPDDPDDATKAWIAEVRVTGWEEPKQTYTVTTSDSSYDNNIQVSPAIRFMTPGDSKNLTVSTGYLFTTSVKPLEDLKITNIYTNGEIKTLQPARTIVATAAVATAGFWTATSKVSSGYLQWLTTNTPTFYVKQGNTLIKTCKVTDEVTDESSTLESWILGTSGIKLTSTWESESNSNPDPSKDSHKITIKVTYSDIPRNKPELTTNVTYSLADAAITNNYALYIGAPFTGAAAAIYDEAPFKVRHDGILELSEEISITSTGKVLNDTWLSKTSLGYFNRVTPGRLSVESRYYDGGAGQTGDNWTTYSQLGAIDVRNYTSSSLTLDNFMNSSSVPILASEVTNSSPASFVIAANTNAVHSLRPHHGQVYIQGIVRPSYEGEDSSASLTIGKRTNSRDFLSATVKQDRSIKITPTEIITSGGTATLSGTWTSTSFASTDSDANLKHEIESLPNKYTSLFDNLKPVRFKYNNGTSNRYHVGFIAQDVEQAILDSGLTTNDVAGYIKEADIVNDNGVVTKEGTRSIRYGEFVALNTDQIQKLKTRVAELETTVEELTKLVNEKLNQA